MAAYCIHCMRELRSGDVRFCPYCGKSQAADPDPHQLCPGTVLQNKYMLGAVLGEGGFGITYIGRDLTLDLRVAVKEFYPNGFVNRQSAVSDNVTCSKEERKQAFFQKGKSRFLQEARVLAKFAGEPGIVDVRDFFEANGTAYIVMEFVDGETLKAHLQAHGVLSQEATLALLTPVMESLKLLHRENVIHRDISPDNIMLAGSTVKLLDFGAARSVGDDQKSLSVMLKPGYAPEEQYRSRGHQGPWTDVYALCATIYKCVTGLRPDPSNDRIWEDKLQPPSALGVALSPQFEAALMKGLAVRAENRWQSVDDLLEGLRGRNDIKKEAPPAVEKPAPPKKELPEQPPVRSAPQPAPKYPPQQPEPIPPAAPVYPPYPQNPGYGTAPQPAYQDPVYQQPNVYAGQIYAPPYYPPQPAQPPVLNKGQTLSLKIAQLMPYALPVLFLLLEVFTLFRILAGPSLVLSDVMHPLLCNVILIGAAGFFFRQQMKLLCGNFTVFAVFQAVMVMPMLNSVQHLVSFANMNTNNFDISKIPVLFTVFTVVSLLVLLVVILPFSAATSNKAKKIYIKLFPQCLLLNFAHYFGLAGRLGGSTLIPALVLLALAALTPLRYLLQMLDPIRRNQYQQTVQAEVAAVPPCTGTRVFLLILTAALFVCALILGPQYTDW